MSRIHPPTRRAALIAAAVAALVLPAIASAQQPPAPHVPPFAAGHNAVIDDGNPGGWASPQTLAQAVKGHDGITAPITPDRDWTDEARRLGTVPPLPISSGRPPQPVQRVGRTGPILMLAIGNDKVLKLFDYGSLGMEARRAHLFDSFLPAIGYYVVRVQEYEDGYHYLISATTGAMTALLERPVVSPDRGRAFSWHDSQMVGRTLDVVRITPARATPEKVAWEASGEPDGLTYDVAWAPDAQAIIVTETNSKTRQRKTVRLVFKNGAWRP